MTTKKKSSAPAKAKIKIKIAGTPEKVTAGLKAIAKRK